MKYFGQQYNCYPFSPTLTFADLAVHDGRVFWPLTAYRQSVSVHECLLTILSVSPHFLQFSKIRPKF